MKILLLIDNMGSGGAERQMSYLAIEAKKKDNDVRLVKFFPGENFYEAELNHHQIFTEVANCGSSKIKRPFYIAKLVKSYKPNIVIAYKDGTCMAACLARLIINFNLVVSERNTTQTYTLKDRIKFILYSLANCIVPNSNSQLQFINRKCWWLRKKSKVITNMIDTEKFKPSLKSSEDKLKHIITTARITPQKNIINYLYAIQIVKRKGYRIHFDWYGRNQNDEYYSKVKLLINELGIQDYITFHEEVNNIETKYKEATYFCLPSSYEGFPNVLCEAMASGLVCTASDVCDNSYILKNEKLRFDPNNPSDIAEKIIAILNLSDEEVRLISQSNHKFILAQCSAESFINKYLSLS